MKTWYRITVVWMCLFSMFSLFAEDLTVKIDPAEKTMTVAEYCTLDVKVENVTNLGVFQFDITFDTQIVHADTALLGDFLGSTGNNAFKSGPEMDNTSETGSVRFAGNAFGDYSGPDGSGILAQVVFSAVGLGTTTLSLENVQIGDMSGATQTVQSIQDGQITVSDGGTTSPGWETQTSEVSKRLRDVCVVSDQVVWVFGDNTVLRTTNGGSTWSSVGDAIDSLVYLSGYAIDANTALASGWKSGWNKSVLLRTADGGTNWDVVYNTEGHWTTFIVMSDANNGYFYGDPVDNTWLVKKTTDGGATWNICNTAPATNVENEYCFASSYFWDKQNLIGFCSNSGYSYLSTDFGQTWSSVQVLDSPALNTVAYGGSDYAVTGMASDGSMARSSNNGSSWTEITPPSENWIYSLNYFNNMFYLLIGTEIYTSTDGSSWTLETTSPDGNLRVIDYYNAADGIYAWAVGNNGTIIKYSPTGTFIDQDNRNLIPETCILKQNNPNPFNPSTTISYTLSKKGQVQLKIYDLLGKCVATLVDTFQNPGEYQINWQAKGLSSGVYFCRLTTAEGIQTIKLLYLQ